MSAPKTYIPFYGYVRNPAPRDRDVQAGVVFVLVILSGLVWGHAADIAYSRLALGGGPYVVSPEAFRKACADDRAGSSWFWYTVLEPATRDVLPAQHADAMSLWAGVCMARLCVTFYHLWTLLYEKKPAGRLLGLDRYYEAGAIYLLFVWGAGFLLVSASCRWPLVPRWYAFESGYSAADACASGVDPAVGYAVNGILFRAAAGALTFVLGATVPYYAEERPAAARTR